jgi:hypothetical protein
MSSGDSPRNDKREAAAGSPSESAKPISSTDDTSNDMGRKL